MRPRDRAIVVILVGAGHALVLGYLAYSHIEPVLIEPPVVTVSLVDLPPPRPAEPRRPRKPEAPPTAPFFRFVPPAPPDQPAAAPSTADLNAAPFINRGPRPPHRERAFVNRSRETCEEAWKRLGYPGPPRCDGLFAASGGYDPAKTEKGSGFAREARRKEDLRTYRDTTSADTYPGLGCTIFHKC